MQKLQDPNLEGRWFGSNLAPSFERRRLEAARGSASMQSIGNAKILAGDSSKRLPTVALDLGILLRATTEE